MIKKDGFYWVHSAKKYCEPVDALPENAVPYRTNTCAIQAGLILKDERKNCVLYHVHLSGGSDPKKYGVYGRHMVYKAPKE